jgi:hypothetical protein
LAESSILIVTNTGVVSRANILSQTVKCGHTRTAKDVPTKISYEKICQTEGIRRVSPENARQKGGDANTKWQFLEYLLQNGP